MPTFSANKTHRAATDPAKGPTRKPRQQPEPSEDSLGAPSRVLHVVYPGVKLLDFAGPLQVFHDARRLAPSSGERGAAAYRPLLISRDGGDITTDVGLAVATTALSAVRVQPDDVVLVPGGPGVFEAARDEALTDWLARLAPRALALDLARRLVVHSKRSGGQSQFSTRLRQQVEGGSGPFDALHEWVANHLDEDLRVERLAERAAMTPRTFHRTYTKTMGETPAKMVASLRIDAARRLLEETDEGIAAVALRCGFGTEDQLRRTFQRTLGTSPSAYRTSWSAKLVAAED